MQKKNIFVAKISGLRKKYLVLEAILAFMEQSASLMLTVREGDWNYVLLKSFATAYYG